jgi:hypothetical protein
MDLAEKWNHSSNEKTKFHIGEIMLTADDIDNIDVSNIVILDLDISGDMYMENLFFRWPDVVVMTLEGKYPTNPFLKNKVLAQIQNDPNIVIFCFGTGSEKLNVASAKKFRMAPFLLRDACRYAWSESAFDFDDEKLINLMKALSLSCNKLERLNTYNNLIDISIPSSIKWFHNLIRN